MYILIQDILHNYISTHQVHYLQQLASSMQTYTNSILTYTLFYYLQAFLFYTPIPFYLFVHCTIVHLYNHPDL